jgi:hypothetical protein
MMPPGVGFRGGSGVNPATITGGCTDPSRSRGAIHQFLNIILQLRILVLLPVSTTMPYVVKVKNYS